jgi:Ca2+-binding EF-hand superfamily protein
MFDKAQVMEFKDAFSIMDTNSDGLVDINDLKVTFERLGTDLFIVVHTGRSA